MILSKSSPSKGTTSCGKDVYFFEESKIRISGDKYYVPSEGIIATNERLIANGILCMRRSVSQASMDVILEEQDFYQVIASNISGVSVGDLVVCKEYSAYKFKIGETQLSFFFPETILLVASLTEGFKSGPMYVMLDSDVDVMDKDIAEKIHEAHDDNSNYYFKKFSHKVILKGRTKIIVNKKDMKLVTDHQTSSSVLSFY